MVRARAVVYYRAESVRNDAALKSKACGGPTRWSTASRWVATHSLTDRVVCWTLCLTRCGFAQSDCSRRLTTLATHGVPCLNFGDGNTGSLLDHGDDLGRRGRLVFMVHDSKEDAVTADAAVWSGSYSTSLPEWAMERVEGGCRGGGVGQLLVLRSLRPTGTARTSVPVAYLSARGARRLWSAVMVRVDEKMIAPGS